LSLAEASGDVGVPKLPGIFQWRSELMSGLGRYADAVTDARRAVEIADRIGELERYRVLYKSELGRALMSASEPAQAEVLLREAKDYYERNGPEREFRLAREQLAVVAFAQGHDREAAAAFAVLAEEQVSAGLAETSGHATTLGRLSLALASLGNSAEAERLLREAIEIDANLLDPANPGQGRRLLRLADFLNARGAIQEARAMRRSAIDLMTKGFGADNPMVVLGRLDELSDLPRDGAIAEGTTIVKHCATVIAATMGPESADMASCLASGARWKLRLRDLSGAAQDADHAIAIETRAHGGLTPRSFWTILLQSEIALADDRPADALARCDVAEQLLGGDATAPRRVSVLADRAAAQAEIENVESAERSLRQALDLVPPGVDSDAIARHIGLTEELGSLLVKVDRGGEAAALWTALLAAPPPPWALPMVDRGLAGTRAATGQPALAVEAYDRALALDRASLGDAAVETVSDEAGAASVLADLGRFDLAEERVRAIPSGRNPGMDLLRVSLSRNLAARQGDFPGASVHQARIVALLTETWGADSPWLLPELVRQGRLDLLIGRRDEAAAWLPRAEALAVRHARLAGTGLAMFRAELARAEGRMDDAEQSYRAAVAIASGPLGGPGDQAFAHAALGEFYLAANRLADASVELRAALALAEAHAGSASLFTGGVLWLLARLDDQTGDAREAASFRARATAIFGAGVGTVKLGRWL
jgi:tetratricopeptide (TPR) repeat protein